MERIVQQLTLWNWRIVVAQTVAGVGLLAVFWQKIPPEVPLLYSRPWGTEQLVSPLLLWLLPISGLVVGGIIGTLATKPRTDPLLKIMTLGTSLVIQGIILLGLFRIVVIVT